MRQIYLFSNENEKKFLQKKGTVVTEHNFKNFFPRFLSGNIERNYHNSSLTIHITIHRTLKIKIRFGQTQIKKFFMIPVSFPLF